MEHGIVRDWDDMERIWQYIYSKDQLQTFSEEVIVAIVGQGFLVSILQHMYLIISLHAGYFCCRLLTYFKINFLKDSFRNTIRVSNRLEPD